MRLELWCPGSTRPILGTVLVMQCMMFVMDAICDGFMDTA